MSGPTPRPGAKGDIAHAVSFHTDGHARDFLKRLRQHVAHLKPRQSMKIYHPLAQPGTMLRVRKDETGALIVTHPKTKAVILKTTPNRCDVAFFLGRTAHPVIEWDLVNCYFSDQKKPRPK